MKRLLLIGAILAISILPIIAPASRVVATPTLGNYPNISILLSSDTPVTPDAPPTNTTGITVSTSTNFKGTLEGYPATGVVRVTNANPAGAYTVTVRAFDSGGASVTNSFTLMVTTPATCIPVSFAGAANFSAEDPHSIVAGDFNGDGKQDLAVAISSSHGVSIFLGNGAGNFSAVTDLPVGSNSQSLAVGDFNGDGRQDLAVATEDGVAILLGNGAGGFSAATIFGAGFAPGSIAVGDFNGDGKQDLAVTDSASNKVSILLGDGTGNFGTATNFVADDIPISVAVGDFNGDGKQDLAIANFNSDDVSILLGDGTGNFGAASNLDVGSRPRSVAVGDFNDDGNQDLAVASAGSSNVSVLLGDGAGNFGAAINFPVGTFHYSIAVGDFNGDGKQDLAVANSSPSENVSILLGDGTGNFGAATDFAAGALPFSLAVGDFNGDGQQDLAVANQNSNNVSILLRNCIGVSRKTHGAAGTFDINLPSTGVPGIECRTGGPTNDYAIAVAFSGNPVISGNPQAQVTSGTGTVGTGGVSNGGVVAISGNVVTVPLTNVTNRQTINVTLFGVNGGGNLVIPMTLLGGDVNGNGAVNASDVSLTKSRIGQLVDATNFPADANANGVINATDVSIVKSHIGAGLP